MATGVGRHLATAVRARPELRQRLQKRIWKSVYGMASRGTAGRDTAFMNYGYAELADAADVASGDAYGNRLYERTLGGIDLTGRNVLEVGCGRGGGTAYLFEAHRPRTITGLDLARSAIQRCRRDHARPGVHFVQGDAEALPFADAAFDAVVNVESAHCYPNVPRFLAEVHRVLRPGGHLLLADVRLQQASSDDGLLLDRQGADQLRAEIEASPFAVLEHEDITANVAKALELDSPRRRASIAKHVPKALQQQALVFSAVEGTPLYESLTTGDGSYQRWVLRKDG